MSQEKTFSYQYSAKENEEIQEIRNRYLPKSESKLDELKKLDAKVKRPVNVFGYVFGSVSAIIMGSGMSLVMTNIGEVIGLENTMMPGIIIGVVGMLLAIINYPMYKKLLDSRKKKYAAEIVNLSDKIMQG